MWYLVLGEREKGGRYSLFVVSGLESGITTSLCISMVIFWGWFGDRIIVVWDFIDLGC